MGRDCTEVLFTESFVWITICCGKFWKRWEYQTTRPPFWEICIQVRKEYLELDMEQQICSKWGKGYVKAVYCHPAYLTYMQSTSWETLGWKKHKLESRLPGEISITSDMQMTPPYGRKWRRTKKPLDCREPAWGIPPVTRSCRRKPDKTLGRVRLQGFPLETPEHPPAKIRICLLYYVMLSTYSSVINRGLSPHHLFLEKS